MPKAGTMLSAAKSDTGFPVATVGGRNDKAAHTCPVSLPYDLCRPFGQQRIGKVGMGVGEYHRLVGCIIHDGFIIHRGKSCFQTALLPAAADRDVLSNGNYCIESVTYTRKG